MKKLSLVLLIAAGALAQSAGPTPAALAACNGRGEGTQCTITLEDGDHQGVCMRAPRDEAASCMPKPVPAPPAMPQPPSSFQR